MRAKRKTLVVVLCVVTFVAVVAPTVTAEPWWPEPCRGLRWWSPPVDIWLCVLAVMNELFMGLPGFEDPWGW